MKKLMLGFIVIANIGLLASCDQNHTPKTSDPTQPATVTAPAS